MRRAAIVCSLGLSVCFASFAKGDPSAEDGYYQGKLGKQAITMEIAGDSADAPAQYRYLRFGPPILLDMDHTAGSVELTEEADGKKPGGQFSGHLDEKNALAGLWTSGDEKRSIEFSFKRISRLAQYQMREPNFSVEYSIPQFTAKSAFYAAVNQELAKRVKDEMNRTAARDRKAVQDPANGPFPWDETTNVEVLHADDSMVSLLFTKYEYAGGAHGVYEYTARTYIWQDGDVFELQASDLVSAEAMPKVTEMVIAELQRRKASWPQYARKVALKDEVINPTVGGLMFTFGPYEVGSYAQGSYSVIIPYSRLGDAIPEDSPVRRLIAEPVASAGVK